MSKDYEVVSDFRDNAELRASFCRLAKKTFWIDFENYYQKGYWKDEFNPHVIVIDGEIVSNISVNKIKMRENGIEHNIIQLGTVMTDEKYRNRGLNRVIMETILNKYRDAEGIYLFGNDSVLDFYPKFGFKQAKEFCCSSNVQGGKQKAIKVPMENSSDWNAFQEKIKPYHSISSFASLNPNLNMFYLTSYLKDDLYYIEETDSYVVAEIEENELILSDIWTQNSVNPDLNIITSAFGENINHVRLHFSVDNTGYELKEFHEDDCTLFVMGTYFKDFSSKKLVFPQLSHA